MLQECISTLHIGKEEQVSYAFRTEQKGINKCSLLNVGCV